MDILDELSEKVRLAEVEILSMATLLESYDKGAGTKFIKESCKRMTEYFADYHEEAIVEVEEKMKSGDQGRGAKPNLTIVDGGKDDDD